MIKKALLLALASALSVSASAAPNNVGCGLGSTVWDGQSGLAPQILAATTNGISGNQTFGITFGTSGCAKNGVVNIPAKVALFTDENLDKVARDMASGAGEALESLASLMEVKEQDKTAFFTLTREHFGDIFAHAEITSTEMLANLDAVLSADPVLQRYSFS